MAVAAEAAVEVNAAEVLVGEGTEAAREVARLAAARAGREADMEVKEAMEVRSTA